MICIDTQRDDPIQGEDSARLVSTLPGDMGTKELISFGRTIGLHPSWLEEKGTPEEHFVLWDEMVERALENGAKRGMHDLDRIRRRQQKSLRQPP